jgi:hypothetical protein
MKARQLKRRHVERLRWRLLIERVAQGVEQRLIDWLAEQWARAAAEAVATGLRARTDLVSEINLDIEQSLAKVQALRNTTL